MKPSPAPGKCDQSMNMIFDFICGIRAGINPAPTVAECCNHFYNPLIAKVLHTSAVGAGFIPALPTADKIQSKYPAAARTGIQSKYPAAAREGINPSPTVTECCYHFDNPLIAKVLHTSAVAGFILVLLTTSKN